MYNGDNKCYSAIDWYLMEAQIFFFTRINHITTVTDMSRMIVNSGHPVAKLSFSDERHVNRYVCYNVRARNWKKKRGKKRDKSHLSRVVPLHTHESDFYVYT